jgi:hypothetical protein
MHWLKEGVLKQPESDEDECLDEQHFDVGGSHESGTFGVKIDSPILSKLQYKENPGPRSRAGRRIIRHATPV